MTIKYLIFLNNEKIANVFKDKLEKDKKDIKIFI